jgi:hypothetical protein
MWLRRAAACGWTCHAWQASEGQRVLARGCSAAVLLRSQGRQLPF